MENEAPQHTSAAFRRRRPKTDEKAEVEEKIVALQKIVPGGERLPVAELFEETAEYIFALECQVKALRFLAALVQTSDNRKRKLGG